jgi:hypothetical protein
MRKASKAEPDDELRPEYDFSSLAGGVRGKYYKSYRAGANLALEPEVAKAFPTDAALNEALRTVLRATRARRRPPWSSILAVCSKSFSQPKLSRPTPR